MKFNWRDDYLALDFDGVVINSVEECLFVAYNAFAEYSNGLFAESLEQIDPVITSEFKRMRNFIRAGADFLYIIMAIEQDIRITNQQEFDAFSYAHKDLEKTFFDIFYKQRELLSSEKPDLWIKLNPLYMGLKEFLSDYPAKERLFIITTKKIFFVQKILSFYGIPFIESHLFNADRNKSKREIIQDLLKQYKITSQHFWFVDDQVDTLIKVRDLQIHCLLAEWGYNDAAQIQTGIKENIKSCNLVDFYKLFSF